MRARQWSLTILLLMALTPFALSTGGATAAVQEKGGQEEFGRTSPCRTGRCRCPTARMA